MDITAGLPTTAAIVRPATARHPRDHFNEAGELRTQGIDEYALGPFPGPPATCTPRSAYGLSGKHIVELLSLQGELHNFDPEYKRKEQAVELEEKENYVTKEDFMNQVGVMWMFIMLTMMAIISDDQVFQIILVSISFLMFVLYMGYSRMLRRRQRRATA